MEDANPFNVYITGVAYAIYCAYHQTHRLSPGQLVFGRDMFLPVDSQINWEKIFTRKQKRISKINEHKNSKRIKHNYQKGDWVTLIQPEAVENTFSIGFKGPYKVAKQHKNRSITIQVAPYETKKKVNKQRLQRYYWLNNDTRMVMTTNSLKIITKIKLSLGCIRGEFHIQTLYA